MRRTELARGTSKLRRSELKRRSTKMNRRQPMPKKSERQKDYAEEFQIARKAVMARCRGVCERCGEQPAVHVHHRLRRSQGGSNDIGNLAALDDACHRAIHDNPKLSYEVGWLLHR